MKNSAGTKLLNCSASMNVLFFIFCVCGYVFVNLCYPVFFYFHFILLGACLFVRSYCDLGISRRNLSSYISQWSCWSHMSDIFALVIWRFQGFVFPVLQHINARKSLLSFRFHSLRTLRSKYAQDNSKRHKTLSHWDETVIFPLRGFLVHCV